MKALGLRTTIYKTNNLDHAKVWYAKAFETEPYFDEPFYVGFNIAGYELGLLPDSVSGEEKREGNVTYWGVNDIKEAYDNLLNHGARALEAPQNVGGDIMVATVTDPWGNVIGIIYNPEFKLP